MISAHPPGSAGSAQPYAAAVWLDLLSPTDQEIRAVERETGLRLPTRAELGQIEQSSRLVFEGGALRLSCPVVAGASTDHPELSELGLILTPARLISIRFDALPVFDQLAAKVDAEAAAPSSATLFAGLMEAIVERLADLLETARSRLDEVSHQVFRRQPNSTSRRAMRSAAAMREKLQLLGRIGERTSMIRETLLAVDRMIAFSLEAEDWFDQALTHRLVAARNDVGSLGQFEEHLLGKVQFLLDAVLGFISIEQNDIFKVLTIASVVGIFPTLVVGWYGMNFANMSEYHWAYGYQFGIGVILVSTLLPLLWFKWRGWI